MSKRKKAMGEAFLRIKKEVQTDGVTPWEFYVKNGPRFRELVDQVLAEREAACVSLEGLSLNEEDSGVSK